jgi:hypothetical protein
MGKITESGFSQGPVRGVPMSERPTLIMNAWLRGYPFSYECSLCGQKFLLPDDRDPKEAVAEVRAAFKDHVREEHPEDVTR